MNAFKSYPILKLLGLFIIGIASFNYVKPISGAGFVFFLIATIGIHAFYSKLFGKPSLNWIFGLCLAMLFVFLGGGIAKKDNQPLPEGHFSFMISEDNVLVARILEPLQEKTNTLKAILSVEVLKDNDTTFYTEGKCIAYIAKDSAARQLSYGDEIVFQAKLSEVEEPRNPHQFNYKQYLSSKEIHHQVYIPSDNWEFVKEGKSNLLFRYAYQIRNYLIETLYNNGLYGDEFAVATALILGYDDKISYELSEKFSHAGAMHVLCVSGLHVGIIYLIVLNLLAPITRLRRGKIIRLVLVVLVIWCFAFITGLSSSVMRSATMFSFVDLGSIIKRKNNIYNTLALSAFLLLIIDSNLLYDIGFQLSYSAVIGIVAIQPGIYEKWKAKTWLMKKIWAISTVSIAAQIGTLPLALFYFHQFPNYFILSNLLVIPLATFILYFGVAVIVTAPIKILSTVFAKVLSSLIYALNFSVGFIDSLPYSFSDGIILDDYQVVVLILAILSFYWFFKYRKKKMLHLGFICILILMSLNVSRNLVNSNKRQIVVYDTRNSTAIDFNSGGRSVFYADSVILSDQKTFNFSIRNNRWYSNIDESFHLLAKKEDVELKEYSFKKKNNFIQFQDKIIAFISPINSLMYSNKPIEVDYLIVSGNPEFNNNKVLQSYKCKKIIFDASNKIWNVNKWVQECEKLGITYYSVPHNGAFIEEL